jgi:hypothetical protein
MLHPQVKATAAGEERDRGPGLRKLSSPVRHLAVISFV